MFIHPKPTQASHVDSQVDNLVDKSQQALVVLLDVNIANPDIGISLQLEVGKQQVSRIIFYSEDDFVISIVPASNLEHFATAASSFFTFCEVFLQAFRSTLNWKRHSQL